MSAKYQHATWRLIEQALPAPAALNLAVDEAILRAVGTTVAPPTLRLYAWFPPALILGRGQPYSDLDTRTIASQHIDVARRMSGGTAVLNGWNLSYSVAVPGAEPRLGGAISESYRNISEALAIALQALGIASVSTARDIPSVPAKDRSPVCFEIPSMYEITVNGRKVVGNSQMRIRNAILQHGSIPLEGNMADIADYLSAHPDSDRIRARAATLFDVSGRHISWQELSQAIVSAFTSYLNLDLKSGSLMASERDQVERLMVEKYANSAWTQRV